MTHRCGRIGLQLMASWQLHSAKGMGQTYLWDAEEVTEAGLRQRFLAHLREAYLARVLLIGTLH